MLSIHSSKCQSMHENPNAKFFLQHASDGLGHCDRFGNNHRSWGGALRGGASRASPRVRRRIRLIMRSLVIAASLAFAASKARDRDASYDKALEVVYGEPYPDWKKKHQKK